MSRTPPHFITLVALTAFAVLSLTMFVPSLANIAADLGTSYAMVSLAVAGYLIVSAALQLIIGPLSDRYGRRPVMLVSLAIFTIGSVGCALAQDIATFLAFRVLQGTITAGYALGMVIVRDTHSEEKSAGMIATISMAMAVAPMLGPTLGGALDTAFGWRANFHVYTLGGLALFALCWFDLGETRARSDDETQPVRVAPVAILRETRFLAYALCTAFSRGGFYVFVAGAPFVAQAAFGISTTTLGMVVGSITAGFVAGAFLSSRLSSKADLNRTILAGRLAACLGPAFSLVCLMLGVESPWPYFAGMVLVGFGNGVTIPGSDTRAISVNTHLSGSAAGWIGALTLAAGAALTALTGAVLTPTNAAAMLAALILAVSALSLISALWALRLEAGRMVKA